MCRINTKRFCDTSKTNRQTSSGFFLKEEDSLVCKLMLNLIVNFDEHSILFN